MNLDSSCDWEGEAVWKKRLKHRGSAGAFDWLRQRRIHHFRHLHIRKWILRLQGPICYVWKHSCGKQKTFHRSRDAFMLEMKKMNLESSCLGTGQGEALKKKTLGYFNCTGMHSFCDISWWIRGFYVRSLLMMLCSHWWGLMIPMRHSLPPFWTASEIMLPLWLFFAE